MGLLVFLLNPWPFKTINPPRKKFKITISLFFEDFTKRATSQCHFFPKHVVVVFDIRKILILFGFSRTAICFLFAEHGCICDLDFASDVLGASWRWGNNQQLQTTLVLHLTCSHLVSSESLFSGGNPFVTKLFSTKGMRPYPPDETDTVAFQNENQVLSTFSVWLVCLTWERLVVQVFAFYHKNTPTCNSQSRNDNVQVWDKNRIEMPKCSFLPFNLRFQTDKSQFSETPQIIRIFDWKG